MSTTPTKRTKRPPAVRLAEGGAPSEAQEAAVEARADAIFLEKVGEQSGEPLTGFERVAMLDRMRYRKREHVANPDGDELAKVVEVVPPNLYADLGNCGKLTVREWNALVKELQVAIPGHAHGYAPSYPVTSPTKALPGTPEKVEVMAERVRLKQSAFHPDDAKWGDARPAAAPAAEGGGDE